jgi:hypothetical protein
VVVSDDEMEDNEGEREDDEDEAQVAATVRPTKSKCPSRL